MAELLYTKTLWVAPNGSNSNPGTVDRPFRTIQKAIDVATAGTAVFVKEGVYKESLDIGGPSSHYRLSRATEQAPFTLVSADGQGKAVIVGDSPTDSTVNIAIGHVRIHDFEIRGVADAAAGDYAPVKIVTSNNVPGADRDVIIDGNIITGTGRDGIKAHMIEDLIITNNTFDLDVAEDFIDYVTVWDSTIAFNTFEGEARRALNFKTASQNIDVTNNFIHLESNFTNTNVGVVDIGGDGSSQLDRPPLPANFTGFEARDVVFAQNIVTGDSFYTVRFRGAIDSIVRDNILYAAGPVAVASTRSTSPERYISKNNTISNNIYRDDMRLSVVNTGQGDGLSVWGNRTGDIDDTAFRVGPDRVLSSDITALDDPFPFKGTYDITVRAGGTGTTTAPRFELVVDGVSLGQRSVSNPTGSSFVRDNTNNYRDYNFTYSGGTPTEIEVRFVNGGWDTQSRINLHLFVDYININGARFDAEYFGIISRDDAPSRIYYQQSGMYYKGDMLFDHLSLSPRWSGPKEQTAPIDPDPTTPEPPPPGGGVAQTIVVRAAGEGGGAAQFEVRADGVLLGTASIVNPDSNADPEDRWLYRDYTFEFIGPEPGQIEVKYINDRMIDNVDRNLFVDYIEVGGARFETEDHGVYTRWSGETVELAEKEAMLWNGTMTFDVASDVNTVHTVVVRAAGEGGGAAQFEVRADGVLLGTASIVNPDSNADAEDRWLYRDYTFEFAGADPGKIEITYVNDRMVDNVDRNLFIDYIDVDGDRFETEDHGVYTRWSGETVDWVQKETMLWNGTMAFDLA